APPRRRVENNPRQESVPGAVQPCDRPGFTGRRIVALTSLGEAAEGRPAGKGALRRLMSLVGSTAPREPRSGPGWVIRPPPYPAVDRSSLTDAPGDCRVPSLPGVRGCDRAGDAAGISRGDLPFSRLDVASRNRIDGCPKPSGAPDPRTRRFATEIDVHVPP